MWQDDEEVFESDKFDECYMCVNRFRERTCNGCDAGEEFEEEDPDNLEELMKNEY
jgi:hypothetical protein